MPNKCILHVSIKSDIVWYGVESSLSLSILALEPDSAQKSCSLRDSINSDSFFQKNGSLLKNC